LALDSGGPSCVHVALWLEGGAGADPPGKSGLAHLYEHLFFQPEDAVSRRLFAELESFGGEPWAATFGDCVRLGLTVPPEGFDHGLRLLAELLGPRKWPAKAVRREAAAIAAEARERSDDPSLCTLFGALAEVYAQFPVAPRFAEERSEVRRVEPSDLESHHASIGPARVILGVAGPSARELCTEAARALQRVLTVDRGAGETGNQRGQWVCPRSPREGGPRGGPEALPPGARVGSVAPSGPRVVVRRRRLDQAYLCLVLRLPDRTEGRQAVFEVLDGHLCQGLSPLLLRELRESAGVYDLTAEFDFWRSTASYCLYTSCAPHATGRVLAAVASTLRRVREKPPETEELRRVKARRRMRLLSHIEAPLMALKWVGAQAVALGVPGHPALWLQQVESVTPEDLAAAADSLLAHPPVLCAVGPALREDRLTEELRQAEGRWAGL